MYERRWLKLSSLKPKLSVDKENNVHPIQQLKDGKFDIDSSHLRQNFQINLLTSKTLQTTFVDENAIDAFLISENIFPVDLKQY